MNEATDRALGWDDEIVKDSGDYILLPEGDYAFKVIDFERARHNGSTNLPACNKAILTLEIDTPLGTSHIKHNIFLHTKTEGLISAFFLAIGQKKRGEKVQMNWGIVVGASGCCKVGIRDWKDNNGENRQSNEIKKFYPKDENAPGSSSATFTAGKF